MLAEWLTLSEAAVYIGVSEKTLYAWYESDRGPKAAKLAGRIRYRRTDIDDWTDAELAATARGGVR